MIGRYKRRLRRVLGNVETKITKMRISDCRTLAYFLYSIADKIYPDCDFLTSSVLLFNELVERFDRNQLTDRILDKKIEWLVENNKLTPAECSDLMFDYSTVPYSFEQDKTVDRQIPAAGPVDLRMINLFRCILYCEEGFFPLLIANVLLKKTPSEDMEALKHIPAHIRQSISDTSQVDFVRKAVGLSENECKLLITLYRLDSNKHVHKIIEDLPKSTNESIIQNMLEMPSSEYKSIRRFDSKLRSLGFIDDDMSIDSTMIECIMEGSLEPQFTDLLKTIDCSTSYPLDSFSVKDDSMIIMRRMLSGEGGVSLLLYGKPGSGKTEFAKSLAKDSGLKPMIFKNEMELESNGDSKPNVLSRLNLLLSIAQEDVVLIIDEADTLLRTKSRLSLFSDDTPVKQKGTINKMLENVRCKVIWIVNFTSEMDESTLRRFNYSCRFDSMTQKQLHGIAEQKLSGIKLESETRNQILSLLDHYKVTGASVDNMVRTIKCLGSSVSGNDPQTGDKILVDCIRSVLKENSALLNGRAKTRESVSDSYDLSVLNSSMDAGKIVQMVKNAGEYALANPDANNGIRMLFYGLSGTGKTEFARYISEQLGKGLLLKRASDILDKYVGGTEQNIQEAFEEASSTGQILLFDEADSFFADRNAAEHSWERTQVNELLTQMEEFNGILICTTNLRSIMDSALNRRFHIIVEFKPLTQDGIRCMMGKYFSQIEYSESQVEKLMSFQSITPGDFGTLSSKVRFMPQDEIAADYIIDELCRMQDEKSAQESSRRKIGFRCDD
ncbi:MAG: ATP-binding protein [Treponema sp.]|nr:ATP-binding protein [Treponema sp.]